MVEDARDKSRVAASAFGDGGGSRRAGQAAALVVIVAAKLDVGSTRCVSRTRLGSARAGRLTRPAAFDVT
ncbi:hypothetical protein [Streptomyces smyrnaeus]|uniref:hypothetical protein n=1 Tax=Streptomyces smyrnaeus TaxID=1387713 RepID=UPI0037BD4C77